MLVTADGRVLPESSDILRWADTQVAPERRLYPDGALGTDAAAFEHRLDGGSGPTAGCGCTTRRCPR